MNKRIIDNGPKNKLDVAIVSEEIAAKIKIAQQSHAMLKDANVRDDPTKRESTDTPTTGQASECNDEG